MRSSSPIVLAFIGLVLAAFWYDSMIASATRGDARAAETVPARSR
jgi:hypothetical protein